MKIIKKAEMPDGTRIQIEDWNKDYPRFYPTSSIIGCYPIAKISDKKWIKSGKTFRLALDFESPEETERAFNSLCSGTRNIIDFKNHFEDKRDIQLLRGSEM
ncbi:hypothetical protein IL308_13535 [Lactococcus lactis]|uniref:hypothetical protein n=1 Tax=Lactococcus lactis TaxID=1358 RepID=UPI0019134914|nr:hypothetical protein [Lactococcus lactis]MBK5077745.1 hypothetical protein [Lactococcus lactis]